MELAVGTPVDKFVVEGLLGRGGMASVYKIRHRDLNVAYALKVMHVTHPELAGRIKSEGMLQAELRHANIVTVLDIVDVGGSPGLVMEFIDGPSLATLLESYRPTLDQIDDIARGILKGVRAAHARDMIHRDLKPANVMLASGDDGYIPKITDFGLAKSLASSQVMNQTRTGAVMGTPAYMAPEQFRNTRGVDARADVYSLGVMLYELCTGQRPYDAEDLFDMLDRVRKADYPRVAELFPSIPDRMADAIDGAMVVDPEQRIPDADSLYGVWCGRVQLDRSRVWDRAAMKRIGETLSSGAEDGPPSSPSIASQGRRADGAAAQSAPAAGRAAEAREVGAPVSGAAVAPEVRTDDVSLSRVPRVAPAQTPPDSAAPAASAAAEHGALEEEEDEAEPDDHTRFERRLSPQLLAELEDEAPAASGAGGTPGSGAAASGTSAPPSGATGRDSGAAAASAEASAPSSSVASSSSAPSATARGPVSGATPGPSGSTPAASGSTPAASGSAAPTGSAAAPTGSAAAPTGSAAAPTGSAAAPSGSAPAPSGSTSSGARFAEVTPPAPPSIGASVVPREHDARDEKWSSTTSGVRSGPLPAPGATDATPSLNLPGGPAPSGGIGLGPVLGVALAVLALGGGGLAVVGLLGVGTLGWWLQPGGGDDLNLPPIEVPADVPPETPETTNPETTAEETTPEGTPEATSPEGTPQETPPEATSPSDTPEAATPHPAPRETAPGPRPTPAKGRVELTGDAVSIRLISASGASFGAGAVPAGTYSLKATFPGQGELDQTAKVVVAKGQKVVVHCRSGFYSCTVK